MTEISDDIVRDLLSHVTKIIPKASRDDEPAESIPQLVHRNQINNQKTQCCLIKIVGAFVIGGLTFRRHYGFPQILPFTIFKERN